MDVGEIMTRAVQTCGPDDTLERAAQIMWDNDCGCVPVVDSAGRAVAMITDRDVCMAAYLQGQPLVQIRVKSAASKELFSVAEDSNVDDALALMERHRIRRIPVIDREGRPVGILSMNDLARHASGMSRHINGLSADRIVQTLIGVCQPSVPHFAAALG
jgi:CBS domain-containing protein